MTQARIILGAVPGGSTDRHLQHLFGTHKVFRCNFNQSGGSNVGVSFNETCGPSGVSTATGISFSRSEQSSFGFTEDEEQVWTPNHTLMLNNNREEFVCMVSPGAELAHWGGATVGIRDGLHLSFDEINAIAEQALTDSPDTYVPNAPASPPQLSFPEPAADPIRQSWVALLSEVAKKLRTKLH